MSIIKARVYIDQLILIAATLITKLPLLLPGTVFRTINKQLIRKLIDYLRLDEAAGLTTRIHFKNLRNLPAE